METGSEETDYCTTSSLFEDELPRVVDGYMKSGRNLLLRYICFNEIEKYRRRLWSLTGIYDNHVPTPDPARAARALLDIEEGRYSSNEGFWTLFEFLLRWINPVQEVLNRLHKFVLLSSDREENNVPMQSPSSDPTSIAYAVVVSALVLLAFVYQYLLGSIPRGGSKLYSSGSSDFRDTYISIVLFRGAYVWLKFREVAFKGVYRKQILDKHGRITRVVYEPRFKPPRENGKVLQWIYVGQYATPDEASTLYQIAAFYYNEDGGVLDLGEGRCFTIPPMGEEERRLTGMEKRVWVKVQTKKVYEDFKKEREKGVVEMLEELLAASEDQVNMAVAHDSEASFPNALCRQPLPVIETPNLQMDTDFSNDGMCAMDVPTVPSGECSEILGAAKNDAQGHAIGFQEGCSVPVAQLITPSTYSALICNTSNERDVLLHTLVRNQYLLISLLQQKPQEVGAQVSESQHQQHLQQLEAQVSELQHQNQLLQQHLQESRIQISHLQSQQCLQQQLQVFNQESSKFPGENAAEHMDQRNYPGLVTLERDM